MKAENTPFQDAESFVRILRLELQEYGGLIDLLQKQQRGILSRDPGNLMEMNLSIELQAEACGKLRLRRERFVNQALGLDDARAADLAATCPLEMQPLVFALIQEIERLIDRVRQKARQNNLLLVRACELTEELIRILKPGKSAVTYGRQGKRLAGLPAQGMQVQVTA